MLYCIQYRMQRNSQSVAFLTKKKMPGEPAKKDKIS
jgi:hypothetical protein